MEAKCHQCGAWVVVADDAPLDGPVECPSCTDEAGIIAWERRASLGWIRAWWKTGLDLTLRYRNAVEQIPKDSALRHPASYLAVTLAMALVCDLLAVVPFVEMGRDAEEPLGYPIVLAIVALQWIGVAVWLPLWVAFARLGLGFTGAVHHGSRSVFRAVSYSSLPLLARSVMALLFAPILESASASEGLFKAGALLLFAYAALAGIIIAAIEDRTTFTGIAVMFVTAGAAALVAAAVVVGVGFGGLLVAAALGWVAV